MRRGEYALGDEIIVVQAYQTVDGGVHLGLEVATLALCKADGVVNEVLVGGLVCSREDERGVGGSILGLVDIDRCASQSATDTQIRILCVGVRTLEIAGVRDNDGAGLLEEVERRGHGGCEYVRLGRRCLSLGRLILSAGDICRQVGC